MGDTLPEARRLRKLLVDVNGIVITGDVSKRVNVCLLDSLCYFGAVADTELHLESAFIRVNPQPNKVRLSLAENGQ